MKRAVPRSGVGVRLAIIVILFASGAAFVSAGFRLWQAPLRFLTTKDDLRFGDYDASAGVAANKTAGPEQTFSRSAPAWLLNALPGYSSGRERQMWYLSLDRAGDERLAVDYSGGTSLTNYYPGSRNWSAPMLSPMAFAGPSGASVGVTTSAPVLPASVDGPAVWKSAPANGDWNNDANWSPAAPNGPNGVALFGPTNITGISLTANTQLADIIFSSTASPYTIHVPDSLRLTVSGAGVTNNSSATQNFVAQGDPNGTDHATGEIAFANSATAGNNRITYTAEGGGDAGTIAFFDSATAGTANFITNASPTGVNLGGQIQFWDGSSADHAILAANGSTGANPTGSGGHIEFFENSDAGAATLIANNGLGPVIEDGGTGGRIRFNDDSTGGTARVEVFGNGNLSISSHNIPLSGPAVTIGSLEGDGYVFLGGRTLGIGSNNQSTTFSGTIAGTLSGDTAGGVTKVGSGTLVLSGANTYTGTTTVAAGELFLTGSLPGTGNILLGDTSANSPSALFAFGAPTGSLMLNNLIVQASASGTEGTRTLLSLTTNDNTSHWSGDILLNTDLTVQAAAVGGSVANGQGGLRLAGTTNVLNHTLEINSNLRGNNADTYSIQGIVVATGEVTSTLATGGSVVKDGSGTLILFNPNNRYTGTDAAALNPAGTQIRGGILEIWGDGTLGLAPSTATNNIFFQNSAYNTNSDSIGPTLRAGTGGITLAGTRNINIATGVNAQFDSNGFTFTINGAINGGGNLAKLGAGTLVLNSANTYTGTTTINAGTLNAANASALGSTSQVTVNSGGTLLFSNSGTIDRINDTAGMTLNGNGSATPSLNTGGLSEYTDVVAVEPGMGALTLQSSSIIDLGNLSSIIAFANSSLETWTGTLSIYNWTGTTHGNGTDQLFFGTNPSGITVAQLGQINFYSDAGTTFLGIGFYAPDLDGEIVPLAVPIPEMSTWIAGAAAALFVIGYRLRVRRKR